MKQPTFRSRLRYVFVASTIEKAWLLTVASVILLLNLPDGRLAQLRESVRPFQMGFYGFLVLSAVLPLAFASDARQKISAFKDYRVWKTLSARKDREQRVRTVLAWTAAAICAGSLVVWLLEGGREPIVPHLEITALVVAWSAVIIDLAVPHDVTVTSDAVPLSGRERLLSEDSVPPFP